MLGIDYNGQLITGHVNLVGLDPTTYDEVSQFGRHLLHPDNQKKVSFLLRDGGYAPGREQFPPSGWAYRRDRVDAFRSRHRAGCGSLADPSAGSRLADAGG